MKQRCYDTNSPAYQNYGGRGITVCEEWLKSRPFCEWIDEHLGPCPDGYTLDRINNDGNYEPGNVQWSSRHDQSINQRERKYRIRPEFPLSKVGYRWVYRNQERYVGAMAVQGEKIYCGIFDTPEDAYRAVIRVRLERGLPIPDVTRE